MALEQVGLRAVIDGMPQFENAARTIDKTYDNLGQSSEKAGSKLSKLGEIAKIAIGVAVGQIAVNAIKSFTASLGNFAQEGAKALRIEENFGRMAATYALDAEKVITALKRTAAGLIDDTDLMQSFNMALLGTGKVLGKELGDKLPALLEIARGAARITGKDMATVFDELIYGIRKGVPRMIESNGILIDGEAALEAYGLQVGILAKDLTEEQKAVALLNATLKAGAAILKTVDISQLNYIEKMKVARVTINQMKEDLGKRLVPLFDWGATRVVKFTDALSKRFIPALDRGVHIVTNLRNAFGKWFAAMTGPFGALISAVGPVKAFFMVMEEKFPAFKRFIDGFTALSSQVGPIKAFAMIISELIPESLRSRLETGARVLRDLGEALYAVLMEKDWRQAAQWVNVALMEVFGAENVEKFWAGMGKLGDKWEQYIAGPLDRLYDNSIKPRLETLGGQIAAWWTEQGGAGGILSKVGDLWQKYIAEPLSKVWGKGPTITTGPMGEEVELAGEGILGALDKISSGIFAWWARQGGTGGILATIAAGWNTYIVDPLVGLWENHLQVPFETLQANMTTWANTTGLAIYNDIIKRLEVDLPIAMGVANKLAEEGGAPKVSWWQKTLSGIAGIPGDIAKAWGELDKPVNERTGFAKYLLVAMQQASKLLELLKALIKLDWSGIQLAWDRIADKTENAKQKTDDQGFAYDFLSRVAIPNLEWVFNWVNQSILDGLQSQIDRVNATTDAYNRLGSTISTLPIPGTPPPGQEPGPYPGEPQPQPYPMPQYKAGGFVPGPVGKAQLGVLHGGEFVVQANIVQAIARPGMTSNFISNNTWSPTVNANYLPQADQSVRRDLETLAVLYRMR